MPQRENQTTATPVYKVDGAAMFKAEIERLYRIERCVRYLVNSNAWVGDTDGIEANLNELRELLNG